MPGTPGMRSPPGLAVGRPGGPDRSGVWSRRPRRKPRRAAATEAPIQPSPSNLDAAGRTVPAQHRRRSTAVPPQHSKRPGKAHFPARVCPAPPLIELEHIYQASRAVERGEETAEDLRYLQGKGTSLGGMRPKCTIMGEDGRLAIGKFPSVSDTRGEVLALKLAQLAGINAACAHRLPGRSTRGRHPTI